MSRFIESLHAYDMGPVVDRLWREEKAGPDMLAVDPDEAAVNTLPYVISRYGGLTGGDLEILSHGQEPWLSADEERKSGGSGVIEHTAMAAYFTRSDLDEETPWPDEEAIAGSLVGAAERQAAPACVDDVDRLRSRVRAG